MAIANFLALLLYLVCGAALIRRFTQNDQKINLEIPIGILTLLALIFHASDILFTMKVVEGWDLGLFSSLSIATWLMALIAFSLGNNNQPAHPGMLVYPIAAISLILKATLPSQHLTQLSSPAVEWHVLLSLAAYSLFTLAALNALVLAIQEKQLRQRHIVGILGKLPPLQTLETSLFQLISIGFILLTVGLITGFVFVDDFFSQHLAHKTVLSIIAWFVFATLLWGRYQYGWRSRTAIKWTLTGFVLLVLAYFGSKLVLEFMLNKP